MNWRKTKSTLTLNEAHKSTHCKTTMALSLSRRLSKCLKFNAVFPLVVLPRITLKASFGIRSDNAMSLYRFETENAVEILKRLVGRDAATLHTVDAVAGAFPHVSHCTNAVIRFTPIFNHVYAHWMRLRLLTTTTFTFAAFPSIQSFTQQYLQFYTQIRHISSIAPKFKCIDNIFSWGIFGWDVYFKF